MALCTESPRRRGRRRRQAANHLALPTFVDFLTRVPMMLDAFPVIAEAVAHAAGSSDTSAHRSADFRMPPHAVQFVAGDCPAWRHWCAFGKSTEAWRGLTATPAHPRACSWESQSSNSPPCQLWFPLRIPPRAVYRHPRPTRGAAAGSRSRCRSTERLRRTVFVDARSPVREHGSGVTGQDDGACDPCQHLIRPRMGMRHEPE